MLFFSCKKELISEAAPIDANTINKNQQLIKALVSGQKFTTGDNANNSVAGTANSATPSIVGDGGGYTVSLVNGMLKFDSPNGMLNFLTAMDVSITNWNTDADPELQGLPTEKSITGDPTKNAFDAAMGFNSLRKKYEMAYYDNPDFKTSLLVNIDEEDTRTILNENNEVQLGTIIYKFMGSNIIAEILNEDYKTLQFLRDHPGVVNNSPNLTLKNAETGLKLPEITIIPLGECMISASYLVVEKYQGDYRQIQLTMLPRVEKDGIQAFCGLTYYVKWGDGFETSPINFSPVLQHTYNVSVTPGQCQAFSISFKITAINCSISQCQGVSNAFQAAVNICNPVVGCGKNTRVKESDPIYFNYQGINYRIIGSVGVQHASSWWPRRNMIYSRTFWQKQNSNGNWYPTKNRKAYLSARVYGPVFKNSCTTLSQRDRSTTKRNQVHMEVNDVIGEEFGYTVNEPNIIKSDHYVVISFGAGYTAQIIGHKLKN